jgi:hypothetical protein
MHSVVFFFIKSLHLNESIQKQLIELNSIIKLTNLTTVVLFTLGVLLLAGAICVQLYLKRIKPVEIKEKDKEEQESSQCKLI